MHKYVVRYTIGADQDLINIYNYIHIILNNPYSADKILAKIHRACNNLAYLPKGQVIIITRGDKEFRFAHVGNYTIIYHVEDNAIVYIDHIIYSRKDILEILQDK